QWALQAAAQLGQARRTHAAAANHPGVVGGDVLDQQAVAAGEAEGRPRAGLLVAGVVLEQWVDAAHRMTPDAVGAKGAGMCGRGRSGRTGTLSPGIRAIPRWFCSSCRARMKLYLRLE